MCCSNKKKKQEKQAQLQRYLDSKLSGMKQLEAKNKQSFIKKSDKSSKVDGNISQINQSQNKSLNQIFDSKLTMSKVFNKSKIHVEENYDPKTINLFKDCYSQLVKFQKISTSHLEYVRKADYFQISQQHNDQLKNIRPQQQTKMANYILPDPSSTTTPSIRAFSYNNDIIDINYQPKVKEYKDNYKAYDKQWEMNRSVRSRSDINEINPQSKNLKQNNVGYYENRNKGKNEQRYELSYVSPIKQYKFQNRQSLLFDHYQQPQKMSKIF